ncbi:MAG: YicC family protein [Candidatus Omnitrophica bacterium]|nr:YicC family protein [Candidatus Omnitrophota bacterium]
MTGFGSRDGVVGAVGAVGVEIRSTNHKFLEIVQHLPEGLLALEDKIKKEIESRLKRGRITCVVTVSARQSHQVCVDKALLGRYMGLVKEIGRRYHISDAVKIDTLINLPGVLSVSEKKCTPQELWPALKKVVGTALDDLIAMRRKEGRALAVYLKKEVARLEVSIGFVKTRFKTAIRERAAQFATDTERAAFLKEADISEELSRLAFHAKSFRLKLGVAGPVGKELDFICQEMQREANTIGAKSCDVEISAAGVKIKSQIEKLREQVQNVE